MHSRAAGGGADAETNGVDHDVEYKTANPPNVGLKDL